jgi:hypothetical protein
VAVEVKVRVGAAEEVGVVEVAGVEGKAGCRDKAHAMCGVQVRAS